MVSVGILLWCEEREKSFCFVLLSWYKKNLMGQNSEFLLLMFDMFIDKCQQKILWKNIPSVTLLRL